MASSEVEKDTLTSVAVVHTEATNTKQAPDSFPAKQNEVSSAMRIGFF
jgi:hypothetical protein